MGGRFESNSQSIVGGLSGSIQLQRVAENPSPLREVADGIWEATWYDPDAHNKVSAFIEKGIKPENRERFSQCLKMYDAGNLPPCSYVDRMVIFDMPECCGIPDALSILLTGEPVAAENWPAGVFQKLF